MSGNDAYPDIAWPAALEARAAHELEMEARDKPSVFVLIEHLRSMLNMVDHEATRLDALDDLVRLRLLVADLRTDLSAVLSTVDGEIRASVDAYQTIPVLDGTHQVTVRPRRTGGSTHWNHAAVVREVLTASGGDVDAIANALGKSAAWKSTELKKLGVAVDSLRESTATDTVFDVIIEGTPT